MKAQIAILGSYPPPHGGAANHVYRLCGQLEQRGVGFRVYNAVTEAGDGDKVICVTKHRQRWLLEYLARAEEPCIYFLSDRLAAWSVGLALERLRGKRVIVRLRNDVLPTWIDTAPLRARAAGALLRNISGVVAVSRLLEDAARRVGVGERRLFWMPGFLPPRSAEYDPALVAPRVLEFMRAHSPTIAASGRVMWHRGEDLYGLDMLVELAKRLRKDHPRVGVVLCFFDHAPDEVPRLEELRRRADEAGVGDAVLFNTVAGPFLPVLKAADVFVRPVNTDGDANTVREALSLGVPAVASDVVSRPEGTLLFRTRDHDDFEARVREALAQPRGEGAAAGLDTARIDAYIDFLIGRGESR